MNDPIFRSTFAEDIFLHKYMHEHCETWELLAFSLAEDVCRGLLPRDTVYAIGKAIAEMKFIPGGRYLYYAARPNRFYNNCFSGKTKVLTNKGMIALQDIPDGKDFLVYSPIEKTFLKATAHTHGKQPVNEITFENIRGRSKRQWKVKATPNHKWPTKRGDVEDLQVGDVVYASDINLDFDIDGYVHGMVFADGNVHETKTGYGHQLRLCGNKSQFVEYIKLIGASITYPPFAGGDPVGYIKSKTNLKNLPSTEEHSLEYIASFIKGWVDLDGHNNLVRQIHSTNEDAISWFVENSHIANFISTGEIQCNTEDSNFGPRKPLFYVNFKKSTEFGGFKVVDITDCGEEIVYCPFEPIHNRIVIDYGIDTFQCFLLKAEEDTREDWANLSWKSESCLMTGGGIGSDYSAYRPKGAPIKRTGGEASGAVSKALMINEIGRRVMQGGSRRSAIYASLNWQHGDIQDFLTIKDWDRLPIGNSGYTFAQAKQEDFNFPCPLDMTNISVNYDTDWIEGDRLNEVFLKNVRQALRTGEPGFSFNFWDKEKETLRNAPVSANTWVMTKNGYVQVKDIINVATTLWTGKQWTEATFKKTAEMVPTVRVRMTGGREIVADPTHEFLVERYKGRGNKRRLIAIDRVPADNLSTGDILHVSLPSAKAMYKDDISYLRGFIFGDGSLNKKYPNRADITFCTDEKMECFHSVKHLPFTSVCENDKRGYLRAYFTDNWFVGKNKDDFPALTEGQLPSFLAGLFDADGSYDARNGRVRLASVHKKFLEGARRALETLGIQASVNHSGKSGYGGQDGYLLIVNGSSISTFAHLIPTIRLKVEPFSPYRDTLIKVVSIEHGPVEDVYCCDVGVEEHSFCAEGVIISNCTEVTSEDDSDVCNLASLNLSRINSVHELAQITELATMFLVCGTIRADLPYEKVKTVREKNRRLGLGLMGVHEWLLTRGYRYEVTPELHEWLRVWQGISDGTAIKTADMLGVSRPVAVRAIAPTGSIGILAGTTTGIEPLFATAYKRRYLKDGDKWHYQYVVDSTAHILVEDLGVDPDKIETALDLAADPERRIKFQYDVQAHVDQSISSTINLPAWGSDLNNEDHVQDFAKLLAKYASGLRGFTCYPDGARGGQPLTSVPYHEAKREKGQEYVEVHDICDISGKGGTCGS